MGLSNSRDLAQLGKRLGITGPGGALTGPQAKMGEMEHLQRVNDKYLAGDKPGQMPAPRQQDMINPPPKPFGQPAPMPHSNPGSLFSGGDPRMLLGNRIQSPLNGRGSPPQPSVLGAIPPRQPFNVPPRSVMGGFQPNAPQADPRQQINDDLMRRLGLFGPRF